MPNPNHVDVTVDGNGTIQCTPDPVSARGGNAVLKFDLQTSGYVFPDSGAIVITDPGTQFPDPSQTQPSKTTVHLNDRNTERGDFKYTVTVKRLSDGQLIEHDPIIKNEL
jgi:hypothetical protein